MYSSFNNFTADVQMFLICLSPYINFNMEMNDECSPLEMVTDLSCWSDILDDILDDIMGYDDMEIYNSVECVRVYIKFYNYISDVENFIAVMNSNQLMIYNEIVNNRNEIKKIRDDIPDSINDEITTSESTGVTNMIITILLNILVIIGISFVICMNIFMMCIICGCISYNKIGKKDKKIKINDEVMDKNVEMADDCNEVFE